MKTAVEWLENEIERLTTKAGIHLSWAMMDDLLNQAKEMEKEQIIDSFKEGTKMIDVNDELSAIFNGIVYYDETFTNI